MKNYDFAAHIEYDQESGMYIGYVPQLPGTHTYAKDQDALHKRLKEVVALCLEELTSEEIEKSTSQYVGTQYIRVSV